MRSGFESYQIYRNFFNDVPIDLFKKSFHDYIKKHDFQEGVEYELEKAFLYNFPYIRSIGAEKLLTLLQNNDTLCLCKEKYSFGLPQLCQPPINSLQVSGGLNSS